MTIWSTHMYWTGISPLGHKTIPTEIVIKESSNLHQRVAKESPKLFFNIFSGPLHMRVQMSLYSTQSNYPKFHSWNIIIWCARHHWLLTGYSLMTLIRLYANILVTLTVLFAQKIYSTTIIGFSKHAKSHELISMHFWPFRVDSGQEWPNSTCLAATSECP